MKLYKKLLPLASVGCIASVVTPLATSCKINSHWLKADYNLDPVEEGYKLCSYENIPLGYDMATRDYAKTIVSDNKILFNDYTYWLSTLDFIFYSIPYILYFFESTTQVSIPYVEINALRGKMSNLVVDSTLCTLTYDLEVKADLELCFEISKLAELWIDPQILFHLTADLKLHFDKCPFFVGPDYIAAFVQSFVDPDSSDIIYGSAVMLNMDRMMVDSGWYENLDFDIALTGENKDVDLGLEFYSDKKLHVDSKNLSLLPVRELSMVLIGEIFGGWSSYYFSNVPWYNPLP